MLGVRFRECGGMQQCFETYKNKIDKHLKVVPTLLRQAAKGEDVLPNARKVGQQASNAYMEVHQFLKDTQPILSSIKTMSANACKQICQEWVGTDRELMCKA